VRAEIVRIADDPDSALSAGDRALFDAYVLTLARRAKRGASGRVEDPAW
jgi:hypothetical protein